MSDLDSLFKETNQSLEAARQSTLPPEIAVVEDPVVQERPQVTPVTAEETYARPTRVDPPRQSQSLLLPAFVLGVFILAAVYLFATLNHQHPQPSPDDNKPKPVVAEVVDAFDDAATAFFSGLGTDIEALGVRVGDGEIESLSQWQKESRDIYTKWDDEFIRTTGEWDNKYVPQATDEVELAAMTEMQRNLLSNPKLTKAERDVLAAYTTASGQGLQRAVTK